MDAVPEGEMGRRIRAFDVEDVRLVEYGLVAVGRPQEQQQLGSLRDRDPRDLDRASRASPPRHNRAVEAQHLLHSARDEERLVSQAIPGVSAREELAQRIAEQARRRLVPRGEEGEQHARNLVELEDAVIPTPHEQQLAREVVARSALPLGNETAEVMPEAHHRSGKLLLLLGGRATPDEGDPVVPCFAHDRDTVVGNAEQLQDHERGQVVEQLRHQVALTQRGEPGHGLIDRGPNEGLELVHAAWRERSLNVPPEA